MIVKNHAAIAALRALRDVGCVAASVTSPAYMALVRNGLATFDFHPRDRNLYCYVLSPVGQRAAAQLGRNHA